MIWWGNVLLLRRFQDLSFEVLRAWKFLYVGPLACSDLIWERECFKVFTTIEQITSVQQNIRYTIHRYIGTVSLFNISTESKSFFWMSISPWFYEWQEVAWSPSVCLAGGPNPRLHRQPSTSFTSPLKKKKYEHFNKPPFYVIPNSLFTILSWQSGWATKTQDPMNPGLLIMALEKSRYNWAVKIPYIP